MCENGLLGLHWRILSWTRHTMSEASTTKFEPAHAFLCVVQESENQEKDEEKNENEDEHPDTAT